jgi:1,4-dihydroxy-2-naphthoyl-CoA hydrolase
MAIWFKPFTITHLEQRVAGTMVEHLGIHITEIGADYLQGTMPVDHRTVQPMGILHGGASIALAETLGSLAANYVVDNELYDCVGLDINGNHIRSVKSGFVIGTAKPFHLGSSTQVWNIEIKNEQNKLVCISRLTMAVLRKK